MKFIVNNHSSVSDSVVFLLISQIIKDSPLPVGEGFENRKDFTATLSDESELQICIKRGKKYISFVAWEHGGAA